MKKQQLRARRRLLALAWLVGPAAMLRLGLFLAPLACGATALSSDPCEYPNNCPNKVYPRADKQTWMMNKSTIIMPCNK
jgi:hypothetical protein